MKNIEIVVPIKEYSIDECEKQKRELIEAAREATQTSYAPYSTYNVGAAVLLDNGEIVKGSNQENAAYTNGICAERTALFYANAKYPTSSVVMVAIAAYTNGDFSKDVCTPCGTCRQVFVEIENRYERPITILMTGKDSVYEIDSIKRIMPLSFGKDSLG